MEILFQYDNKFSIPFLVNSLKKCFLVDYCFPKRCAYVSPKTTSFLQHIPATLSQKETTGKQPVTSQKQ